MDFLKHIHLRDEVLKHLGPDDHPSGSPQSVHGGRNGGRISVAEDNPYGNATDQRSFYHIRSSKSRVSVHMNGLLPSSGRAGEADIVAEPGYVYFTKRLPDARGIRAGAFVAYRGNLSAGAVVERDY